MGTVLPVQATRDHRGANRTVTEWARRHAAELRGLAGQITALTDLPAAARASLDNLNRALAGNDPATLMEPLLTAEPYLQQCRPDLAARITALGEHAAQLRQASHDKRSNP
ncbi:hypothetical protein [Streptomyces sp. 2224.1]|uniref:hypothetical protein n=1 Tax=Streptomyces sp. 2224.1 TaxID=1881020 RepID=UPI000B849712|nr:hypothetical protein [Streptomyces sp. 2224.1]